LVLAYSILNGGLIPKGLVRPLKVIGDKPVSKGDIKAAAVRGEVPIIEPLILEGSIEAFQGRVVLRSAGSVIPLEHREVPAEGTEFFGKLRAVVGVDVSDRYVKEVEETAEEIPSVAGRGSRVHPGVSQFSEIIEGGKDNPPHPVPPQDNPVYVDKFTQPAGSHRKLRNPPFPPGGLSLAGEPDGSDRVRVEAVVADDPLYLPSRKVLPIPSLIQAGQLLLSPVEMLPPKSDDALLFQRRHLPGADMMGTTRTVFQEVKIKAIEPFPPASDNFAGVTEVTAGERDIAVMISQPEEDLQAVAGLEGESEQLGLPL
jgi:hypothetical protein